MRNEFSNFLLLFKLQNSKQHLCTSKHGQERRPDFQKFGPVTANLASYQTVDRCFIGACNLRQGGLWCRRKAGFGFGNQGIGCGTNSAISVLCHRLFKTFGHSCWSFCTTVCPIVKTGNHEATLVDCRLERVGRSAARTVVPSGTEQPKQKIGANEVNIMNAMQILIFSFKFAIEGRRRRWSILWYRRILSCTSEVSEAKSFTILQTHFSGNLH